MLSNTARHFIALFEEETEATVRDCLVFDNRVVFLVAVDDMTTAIGPGGRTVQSVGRQLSRTIELIEDVDMPEAFIASALVPTVVQHIAPSRQDDTVICVEVAGADRGVAIGASGKTIDIACELAHRHYDIDDIQLT